MPRFSSYVSPFLLICILCLFSGCYDKDTSTPQYSIPITPNDESDIAPPLEATDEQDSQNLSPINAIEQDTIETPPLNETHSDRTTESGHRSSEFEPDETVQDASASNLDPDEARSPHTQDQLSAEEIARQVVERLRNDPEFRDVANNLSNEPQNPNLQQIALDFFLNAEPELFQRAINIFAYVGGTASSLLLNGLFFKACRANDPVFAPRHAIWLLGLITESYYALKMTSDMQSFEPWYMHLGLGAFMGAAIIAQCSLFRRLKRFGKNSLMSACKKE